MKSKRQFEERAVLSFTGNPGGSVDGLCGGVEYRDLFKQGSALFGPHL